MDNIMLGYAIIKGKELKEIALLLLSTSKWALTKEMQVQKMK